MQAYSNNGVELKSALPSSATLDRNAANSQSLLITVSFELISKWVHINELKKQLFIEADHFDSIHKSLWINGSDFGEQMRKEGGGGEGGEARIAKVNFKAVSKITTVSCSQFLPSSTKWKSFRKVDPFEAHKFSSLHWSIRTIIRSFLHQLFEHLIDFPTCKLSSRLFP